MRCRVLLTSTLAAAAVAGCVVSFEDYPVADPGSDAGTTAGVGGSTGGAGGSTGGVGGVAATGGVAGSTGGAGGSTGGAGGSTGGAGGSTGGSGGATGGAGGVPACTSCSQHETCVNGICFVGVYEGNCGGGCLSGFTAVAFLVDSANCCNMGAPPLCVRDGTAFTIQDCVANAICEAGKKIGLEVASCSCAYSSYVCIDEISNG